MGYLLLISQHGIAAELALLKAIKIRLRSLHKPDRSISIQCPTHAYSMFCTYVLNVLHTYTMSYIHTMSCVHVYDSNFRRRCSWSQAKSTHTHTHSTTQKAREQHNSSNLGSQFTTAFNVRMKTSTIV